MCYVYYFEFILMKRQGGFGFLKGLEFFASKSKQKEKQDKYLNLESK